MSFVRCEKNKDYSVISNHCARNSELSLAAKGLFFYLMTLPDDWVIRSSEIETHSRSGRTAHRNAFKELEASGYVSKSPRRGEGGRMDGWDYVVCETPSSPNDGKPNDGKPNDGKPNDGKPNDGKPNDGKPNDGKPNDGKAPPTNYSTELSTDKLSTDEKYSSEFDYSSAEKKAKTPPPAPSPAQKSSQVSPSERGYDPKIAHTFSNEMSDHECARWLASSMMEKASEAYGKKLIAKPSSQIQHFIKLFKDGITASECRQTLDWLYSTNASSQYPFRVESGKSLRDKWDRIQLAMSKGNGGLTTTL